MRIKQLLLPAGAVVAAAGALVLAPTSASAHHPIVSGQSVCLEGGDWQVTWTVEADAVRGLTWELLQPWVLGPQPDDEAFVVTEDYPAAQQSAQVDVVARWSNQVEEGASGSASRPENCNEATTTTTIEETTTTTIEETTTTIEETTTTAEATTTTAEATTTTTEEPGPTTSVGGDSGSTTTTTEEPGPTTSVGGDSGSTTTTVAGGGSSSTSPPPGTLPVTGPGSGPMLAAGALLLLAGVALVLGGRRSMSA